MYKDSYNPRGAPGYLEFVLSLRGTGESDKNLNKPILRRLTPPIFAFLELILRFAFTAWVLYQNALFLIASARATHNVRIIDLFPNVS
ncbi:uncharacterized protein DFL_003919 [Arthrobotrys flagrans]|uniref:Uncharacterized protein n=1 Tax=Arthrobotrys flagrans TaxID=97331 RepID=A0A437A370_ARTFL|nr:hypothetical protein DFL_003919 [Arthrobotrys flagrans]